MIRSMHLSAALLSIVLLASAGSVSARTARTVGAISPGSSHAVAVPSSVSSSGALDLLAAAVYMSDGDDGNKDKDRDRDRDRDRDKDHDDKDGRGPAPSPEPSTILSFGVALLVGGGVLLARRLRQNQK